MWTFIIAGSIYLIGIAVVLVVKPQFMFTPDGNWKEFGIGKSEARYTPFPFWLFCLVWSVVAYVIVILLEGIGKQVKPPETIYNNSGSERSNIRRNIALDEFDSPEAEELPRGYYVLNKKASKIAGFPKYVYLGADEP
jgi:hypothetical protein